MYTCMLLCNMYYYKTIYSYASECEMNSDLTWHASLTEFKNQIVPCVFVFLPLLMWKTIWKQFLFVNMSIILIVIIAG